MNPSASRTKYEHCEIAHLMNLALKKGINMTVTTNYPGVYVQEDTSPSLSIAVNATAVPAFVVGTTTEPFTTTTKIGSWVEFMQKVSDFSPENLLHVSLKSYFTNGGGYCYVIPQALLEVEVPKLADVTLLVAAGVSINAEVAALCTAETSLFAILDGPDNDITTTDPAMENTYGTSPYVAVYYPYLNASWAAIPIPPSGAVAGAYCTVDRERGVWKAPANIALKGGLRPKFMVSDATMGTHTSNGALNMIREFKDRGTLIWGARTRDNQDAWRYIPVRRFFNSAEKDIKNSLKMVVFEPNTASTWERVRASITSYLHRLWQQGALLGDSENEAYFVHVGLGVTMDATDINQGKLIVKVGMAAVRPAEFIILLFSQDVAQG